MAGHRKVVIFKGADGVYARIVGANGETAFISEAHENVGDVEGLVASMLPGWAVELDLE